jgi:hypothetical protein
MKKTLCKDETRCGEASGTTVDSASCDIAAFGWAALTVLMATMIMELGKGPRSILVIVYPLLIVGSALRLRTSLLWFVTGLCVTGYIGMAGEAAWRRPYLAVELRSWLVFTVGLVILAVVQHQLLRRLRALTASGL